MSKQKEIDMAAVERLQDLLACTMRVPVRDAAGVIRPDGVDASIRAKAIQDCLKIVEDEENQVEHH